MQHTEHNNSYITFQGVFFQSKTIYMMLCLWGSCLFQHSRTAYLFTLCIDTVVWSQAMAKQYKIKLIQ